MTRYYYYYWFVSGLCLFWPNIFCYYCICSLNVCWSLFPAPLHQQMSHFHPSNLTVTITCSPVAHSLLPELPYIHTHLSLCSYHYHSQHSIQLLPLAPCQFIVYVCFPMCLLHVWSNLLFVLSSLDECMWHPSVCELDLILSALFLPACIYAPTTSSNTMGATYTESMLVEKMATRTTINTVHASDGLKNDPDLS